MAGRVVEIDGEDKIDLSWVGTTHSFYIADKKPDGTIILQPAVILTASEYNELVRKTMERNL